jgi:hypothetical protein
MGPHLKFSQRMEDLQLLEEPLAFQPMFRLHPASWLGTWVRSMVLGVAPSSPGLIRDTPDLHYGKTTL